MTNHVPGPADETARHDWTSADWSDARHRASRPAGWPGPTQGFVAPPPPPPPAAEYAVPPVRLVRPKRRRWAALFAAASIALLAIVLCAIGASSMDKPRGQGRAAVGVTPTPDPTTGAPAADADPTPAPAPAGKWQLKAKDLELSVKVEDRQCFGSAGCNIEYSIRGGVTDKVRALLADGGDSYEITYEVKGFMDGAQIGTLDLAPDATFTQDSFNFGQTKSAGTKLRVKITDIEVRP